MFDTLSTRLSDVFDKLKKRGALSEADVTSALREIRVALLEADVALPVVKDFIDTVRERAVGEEVVRSVTPGQMVVKIVNDHLTEMLGGDQSAINLAATPPAATRAIRKRGCPRRRHTRPGSACRGSVQPAWASLVEDHVEVQASAAAEVDEE